LCNWKIFFVGYINYITESVIGIELSIVENWITCVDEVEGSEGSTGSTVQESEESEGREGREVEEFKEERYCCLLRYLL